MTRILTHLLSAGLLAVGMGLPFDGGMARADESPAAKKNAAAPSSTVPTETKESETAPSRPTKRELPPELQPLRDRVRAVQSAYRRPVLSTGQNTPTEILSACLAFGCDTEVVADGANGGRINGITCLCWDYPCGGYRLLGFDGDRIAPKVGYGRQERPGQFLAVLALSRVPDNYPVRVSEDVRKVSDLVEAEKLSCRPGADLSLKLIGLTYYAAEPEWKNSLGETWSIQRMVEEELSQPIVGAPEGGLNRLMGLSYAAARGGKRGCLNDALLARVKKYEADFQDFALRMQNDDGTWGPRWFAARGGANDPAAQLRATGRILEWLALSLPEDKLTDAQVVKAVERVAALLGNQRYSPALATREIVSIGHALHGLALYDQRVFKPTDDDSKRAGENKAQARRAAETPSPR